MLLIESNITHTSTLVGNAKCGHCVGESSSQDCVFLFQFVVPPHHVNQLCGGVGVSLGGEFADLALQAFNMILGPLSDGSLCLAVVCSFSFQLGGGQGGDTSGACSRGPSFGAGRLLPPRFGAGGMVVVRRGLLEGRHGGRSVVGVTHEVAAPVRRGVTVL